MPYIGFFIGIFMSVSGVVPGASLGASVVNVPPTSPPAVSQVKTVPFYSQFRDIRDTKWQKLGCGITDLAMLIEFYKPGIVSVNTLLKEGIEAGAFLNGAGWKHKDLALLVRPYGLKGASFDMSCENMDTAFTKFKEFLQEGPLIASVYYTFDPKSPIPHLVVINGIKDDVVYYNDPAEEYGGRKISVSDFKKAWKKRFIVIRP